jgi:hypothetical protein
VAGDVTSVAPVADLTGNLLALAAMSVTGAYWRKVMDAGNTGAILLPRPGGGDECEDAHRPAMWLARNLRHEIECGHAGATQNLLSKLVSAYGRLRAAADN